MRLSASSHRWPCQSPLARVRSVLGCGLGLLIAVFVMLGVAGCADPISGTERRVDLSIEPLDVVFHPDTEAVEIRIRNRDDKPIPVGEFRIEGEDWTAFSITDPQNPRGIAGNGEVVLHVAVDRSAFADDETGTAPGTKDAFRDGAARLRFSAAGLPQSVPLKFETPSFLGEFVGPALVKILVLVMLFIMPLASLLTWMERKQSAMMQNRFGPNMAGIKLGNVTLRLWGLLHIAADGLKMLFKEDFIPRKAHRALYTMAPLLAFVPAMVVFAIVPFGDGLCYDHLGDVVSQADVDQCVEGRGGTVLQIANLDVGLLYYFAIASLATYGTTLAGWSSYNKWAILGGLRASAQMISYEVAIGLTIVGALLVYGTLEPHELVRAQLDSYWGIILQPLAFVLFFTAAIAETKRAPFDLPEGESEIIGYFVEYSGMRFGLFFLGEFIEIVFVSAMVTTLFLGGWSLPMGMLTASGFSSSMMAFLFFAGGGVLFTVMGIMAWRASKHAANFGALLIFIGTVHLLVMCWTLIAGWGTELSHGVVVLIGLTVWGAKVALLCWLQLLIRWTLPRFRYDQLMTLGWKGLLPLSLANIIFTAAVVYLLLPGPTPGGP